MVSTKDVALIGGLAVLAGIVVIGGRELFKALPSIGGGISSFFDSINQSGKDAGSFVFNIGQDVGGAVFDAGAGAGQAVFDAGKAFGDFVGSTQSAIDLQLSNFFKVQQSNFDIFTSNAQKDIDDFLSNSGKALGSIVQGIEEKVSTESEADARRGGNPLATFPFVPARKIQQPSRETLPPDFIGAPREGQSQFDPFDESLANRPFNLSQLANQFLTPQELFRQEERSAPRENEIEAQRIAAIPRFSEVFEENMNLTASQIANKKFLEFGGENEFNFGTNTGQALELAMANFGSSVFLQREDKNFQEKLDAEAERSRLVFDSSLISNF